MRSAIILLAPALVLAVEKAPLPTEMGVDIVPYETIYFAMDPGISDGPLSAKFQVSLAIRLFNPKPGDDEAKDGLYVAYSQTSFWDLHSDSKPFFDSSYRPEGWWHLGLKDMGRLTNLGLEPGFGHESNGQSGDKSRSLNHVFVRAIGEWTTDDVTFFATPRGRYYVEKEDNEDIADYRGYFDLSGGVRLEDSWQLSGNCRIGADIDHGSFQLEMSHPLSTWTKGHMNGYAYLQWFTGYSETLLAYDQRSPQPRVMLGYALTR